MSAAADQWDTDISTLGVYPSAAPYPELVDQLVKLYTDRVATVAFVPPAWIDGVKAIAARNPPAAPVIVSPYKTNGDMKLAGEMPDWILSSKANADAWAQMAGMARAIVMEYTAGKIEEGRAEMDRAYRNVAFWSALEHVATTIADAPGNLLSGALGGLQRVTGGIFGALFSSWIFWLVLLVCGGYVAWSFGLLKKRS